MENFTKVATGHYVKTCLLRRFAGRLCKIRVISIEEVFLDSGVEGDWACANEINVFDYKYYDFKAEVDGQTMSFGLDIVRKSIEIYEDVVIREEEYREDYLVNRCKVSEPHIVKFIKDVIRRFELRGSNIKVGLLEPITLR